MNTSSLDLTSSRSTDLSDLNGCSQFHLSHLSANVSEQNGKDTHIANCELLTSVHISDGKFEVSDEPELFCGNRLTPDCVAKSVKSEDGNYLTESISERILSTVCQSNVENCDTNMQLDSELPIPSHCSQNVSVDVGNRASTTSQEFSDNSVLTINSHSHSSDQNTSLRINSDDDDLLAELESEFSLTMTVTNQPTDCCFSTDNDHRKINGSERTETVSLQRRQKALECRLKNTLELRKQLEVENGRLEHKLAAANSALEAAQSDIELLKSEVHLFLQLFYGAQCIVQTSY